MSNTLAIRFIPTGVGNTPDYGAGDRPRAVHPHGRGEHPGVQLVYRCIVGSSPRAWRTQLESAHRISYTRFIPTGVGNTSARTVPACRTAVHPHGRGEHIRRRRCSIDSHGSSPRAWGTRLIPSCQCRASRFIPTGVGNTRTGEDLRKKDAVHPHGRGEHTTTPPCGRYSSGSSPRAWGTPLFKSRGKHATRFIPTGVGNTAFYRLIGAHIAVHPHGRGEHAHANTSAHARNGSSPRAWGTLGLRLR